MYVMVAFILMAVVSALFISAYGANFGQGVFVSGIIILGVTLFWHFLGEKVSVLKKIRFAGLIYYVVLTLVVWLLSTRYPIPSIFYAGTTLLIALAITFIVSAYLKFRVFVRQESQRLELPILPEEIPEPREPKPREPPFEVF